MKKYQNAKDKYQKMKVGYCQEKRKGAKYQYKYKKKIDNIKKQQFQHNVGTYINRLKQLIM